MMSVEGQWSLDDLPSPSVLCVSRPTRDDPIELRLAPQHLREQQAKVLKPQFREAFDDARPIKYTNGTHIDELVDIAKQTKAEFDQLGNLNPEFLYPPDYRQGYIAEANLPTGVAIALDGVKQNRRSRVAAAGRKWNLASQGVVLPPGLLDIPPYRRQGDNELISNAGQRGCISTCFRMGYQAITGVALSELAVNDALWPFVGNNLVPDDLYLKVFRTGAFATASKAKVTPITIGGADFSDIERLTSRLKTAKPSIEVYAMTLLASEHKEDVWHANMLLAADTDTVVVHDPSDKAGGESYRRLDRQTFHERWAAAFNKTHLVVVDQVSQTPLF